jgi:hypothetical protein
MELELLVAGLLSLSSLLWLLLALLAVFRNLEVQYLVIAVE